ncbi:DUF1661 domain-containing protein [Porphyromonas gingivalis]|nr:DUF1661 domain-containing protein [Porphyromonas gingivalis]MDR4975296.1 DUF1661 domain-containing protein [Porphyromonas gingivalis]HBW78824.1 hypothetical protein [Porphyromonas gingivalis]
MAREQKKSRAKTKKISRHVLRSHTRQN